MSTFDSAAQPTEEPQHVEQQFKSAYLVAVSSPETAKLLELWQLVEPSLNQLSDSDQLRLLGLVIDQLAELHTLKADRLLADWQDHHSDEGPIMDADFLQGLVQKTMHLDLTDLVRPKLSQKKSAEHQSVVGIVEKKTVLQMIEGIESETVLKRQALQVAHDENISAWIEMIDVQMQQFPSAVTLLELVRSVNLPLVKVWIALLLGNYSLESRGEFYAVDHVWVYAKN